MNQLFFCSQQHISGLRGENPAARSTFQQVFTNFLEQQVLQTAQKQVIKSECVGEPADP